MPKSGLTFVSFALAGTEIYSNSDIMISIIILGSKNDGTKQNVMGSS